MKGNNEMKSMRIDKFLSQMQVASRSESKKMLKAARIRVNGKIVTDGAEKCCPERDRITVDEQVIHYQEFHYIMLHKPAGCVTATQDEKDKTVMDYIPKELRKKMSPVGRLDKDTEGLLLITDDGALNHNLLAPAKHVQKTYYARIRGEGDGSGDQSIFRGTFYRRKETDRSGNTSDTEFRGGIRDSGDDYRGEISPGKADVSGCEYERALSKTPVYGNTSPRSAAGSR